MSDYWFKPKTRGIGVTPANWKGWAAIAVLGGFVLLLLAVLILPPVLQGAQPSATRVILMIALETIGIIVFFLVARRKTDGAWSWSWRKRS